MRDRERDVMKVVMTVVVLLLMALCPHCGGCGVTVVTLVMAGASTAPAVLIPLSWAGEARAEY